ncbi:hypothetical protein RIF29_19861 [Crotalaria pallida]|uniref:Uncharacterized protein n=1 Tax=Crotalaria pallida TaxID=3830 RepID=A0AAN9F3C3_CROPI
MANRQYGKRIKHVPGSKMYILGHKKHGHDLNDSSSATREPYYSPGNHAKWAAKFDGRKMTMHKDMNLQWVIAQGFELVAQLQAQGVSTLVELKGDIYPSLISEFTQILPLKDEGVGPIFQHLILDAMEE